MLQSPLWALERINHLNHKKAISNETSQSFKRSGLGRRFVWDWSVLQPWYFFVLRQPSQQTAPLISAGSSINNPLASIEYFEDQVRNDPDNVGYQLALAQAYLQHAIESREEATYIPLAERLLGSILFKHPDHYEALALQASLYNTLHQFEKARDTAYGLLERDNNRPFVYGVLVDALVELGEYEEAVQVCDDLLSIKPGLTSYARAAYLRELHGDTEGAMEAMELAAEAGTPGSNERAWTLYQLGQLYMANNDIIKASAIFEGILEERPGYAFAIGGIGHAHLVNGDYEEAIRNFETAFNYVPADEFLEGLMEAYTAKSDHNRIQETRQMIEQSLLDADNMGENVRMEYADFLADTDRDLSDALEWAKLEYERRPAHLHALETYAWTLHQTGHSEEARDYIEQAMRLKTGDAMVYFRAARIYEAINQPEIARVYLQKSLDANLHIESLSAAKEAQELFDMLS